LKYHAFHFISHQKALYVFVLYVLLLIVNLSSFIELTWLVELYLAESNNATHSLVDLDATWGEMEVQNPKTPLAFPVQNQTNLSPVFQQRHRAKLCLRRVAHLDQQLHAELEPS